MSSSKRTEEFPKCIDTANALSHADFIASFLPSPSDWETYTAPSIPPKTLKLSLIPSTQLSKEDLLACFDLIAESSKPDYESSILGWHPVKKKKEMKLLDLKYLLVRPFPSPSQCNDDAAHSCKSDAGSLQGFLSFMPTFEDSIPVLYIYEIHLSPELRGSGLGSHLIGMVEGIAEKVGVEKVMLTCFVRNKGARRFYEKLGYVVEEIVEGRRLRGAKKADGEDESGYLIMSKDVVGSVEKSGWDDVDSDDNESVDT